MGRRGTHLDGDGIGVSDAEYFNLNAKEARIAHTTRERIYPIQQFEAWSINLGHEDNATTLKSYCRCLYRAKAG